MVFAFSARTYQVPAYDNMPAGTESNVDVFVPNPTQKVTLLTFDKPGRGRFTDFIQKPEDWKRQPCDFHMIAVIRRPQ